MSVKTDVVSQDGQLIVVREARFDGLLDTCKALHNEGLHGDQELPVLAHVPGLLIEDYCNRNGVTFRDFMRDDAHVRRFLNDPAIEHFRVKKGRV